MHSRLFPQRFAHSLANTISHTLWQGQAITRSWSEATAHLAYSRFWLAFVVGIGALSNVAQACALPFVCLAVLTGATLPRRRAIGAVTLVWGVNQACGYGLFNYPHTWDSYLWGVAILASTLVATWLVGSRPLYAQANSGRAYLQQGLNFAVGFGVFYGLLYGVGLALQCEPMTLRFYTEFFLQNMIWISAALIVHGILTQQYMRNS
ncbi:MAG: hypothetical protein WCO45_16050 [Pseudanabaena sp. ELA607]|jgi:hypothetical protein